jgi:hypothetical protein
LSKRRQRLAQVVAQNIESGCRKSGIQKGEVVKLVIKYLGLGQ